MQHSILTIGMGSVKLGLGLMPWAILFLQKLFPQKKFQEAAYLSKRVHSGGCQGCPTAEET